MKEIEIIIDTFRDKEYVDKELEILRNGNQRVITNGFLVLGDRYKTSNERAKLFVSKKIAKIVKEEKNKSEEPQSTDE